MPSGVRKLIECIHKNVSYVVEADIRSFFDTIDHEWMIQFLEHEVGSPQGSAASPIFANIYLQRCFQYKEDAEKFYQELPKRFAKFGLELAEEKIRILEFGRVAGKD